MTTDDTQPAPLDDYRVRAYADGDETAILDLFRRAFHVERSVERWRWAYAENPYGNRRASLAVDAAGGVVAHYAGYPVRFWSDADGAGRSFEAHHVGDTMTAPGVRGVGRRASSLLALTMRHFYATWCSGRVAFNFGVNTGKIQRFSRRTAGALRFEEVAYRVRPLAATGSAPWPAPGPLRRRFAGWGVERIAAWDERFDDLFARVRGAYRFLVERDRRYLAWRYGAFPETGFAAWAVSRRGRLAGWGVFRRRGERLVWGDALFDPAEPRAPALLLAGATEAAENRGVDAVEGWFPDRPPWWSERLAALGFERRPEPQDLGVVYVPFEVDPGPAMAEHWYYTKGDFDLF
jgi:hypothetical protein